MQGGTELAAADDVSTAGKPTTGCSWVKASFHNTCPHSNCRVYGFRLKGHGQALHITLDTGMLAGNAAGSPAGSAGYGLGTWFERRYLVVTYIQVKAASGFPLSLGSASMACLQGCSCRSTALQLYNDPMLGMTAVEVSPTHRRLRHTARVASSTLMSYLMCASRLQAWRMEASD
jgi:hypothetical protein